MGTLAALRIPCGASLFGLFRRLYAVFGKLCQDSLIDRDGVGPKELGAFDRLGDFNPKRKHGLKRLFWHERMCGCGLEISQGFRSRLEHNEFAAGQVGRGYSTNLIPHC